MLGAVQARGRGAETPGGTKRARVSLEEGRLSREPLSDKALNKRVLALERELQRQFPRDKFGQVIHALYCRRHGLHAFGFCLRKGMDCIAAGRDEALAELLASQAPEAQWFAA